MRLLEYLAAIKDPEESGSENDVQVGYRLACSGELFRAKVATADWRKSDICRILLEEPFD